jgi:neural cell adhesion molecule
MADAEPRPIITWFYKTNPIKHDNLKYRLIRDEPGFSKLEINPRGLDDFGDYQCVATNRLGSETRVVQLRQATPPKFAPLMYLKAANPESILFDVKPSDAIEADGGMPIEAFKIQWRFVNADFSNVNEKEIEVDLTKMDLYTVEINPLEPDTEYVFRVAAVNRPGVGAWSTKDMKIKTAPRRQPDPVRVTSKEECQTATRCYMEWTVDSTGGSIIREYVIRWRRVIILRIIFVQNRNI